MAPPLCVRGIALAVAAAAAAACGPLAEVPMLRRGDLRFDPSQTTKILARGGRLIADMHAGEDRTVVALRDVPLHVRRAAIAVEDRRFYEHRGVDVRAIARATVANVSNGEIREGGSTITQQLVRNTLMPPERRTEDTIDRKLDEIALARQLERRLTKGQILERYLNTVYFGRGSYGIQAAALTYFHEPVGRLTLPRAALLAGMIRSPSRYDPYRYPRRARRRRNVVIAAMASLGFVRPRAARRLATRRLGVRPPRRDVPYEAPYFVDYVTRLVLYDPRFSALGDTVAARRRQLTRGGLRIHTTLDLDAQAAAEKAVGAVLNLDGDPHGSLVALDPRDGGVRAMVGGRDFYAPRKQDPFAKLNLAIAAEPGLGRPGRRGRPAPAPGTGRQAGSAFKPLALATAIEEGASLGEVYPADACMVFEGVNAGRDWRVCNYEESAFGPVSLLEATINSINVVYAQLILDVGAEDVAVTAARMGITTDVAGVPSAALGTNAVNPLGMASAYATLASGGIRRPPVAVTKITSPTGEILYRDRARGRRVIARTTAYLVTTALEGVIESGTGTAAAIGRPAAGKTGTAQEYRDAWFAGYTPQLAAAVWVGYPEGSIEMKTSCSGTTGCRPTRITVSGGTWPASIWRSFMASALQGVPARGFDVPEGVEIEVVIDTRTGCLAGPDTPAGYRSTASYPVGSQPTTTCAIPSPSPPEDEEDREEQRPPGHGGRGGGPPDR